MALFADFDPAPDRGEPLAAGRLELGPASRAEIRALAALSAARHGTPEDDALPGFERTFARVEGGTAALLAARVDGEVRGYGQAHWLVPPEGAAANWIPEGWYLSGVVVDAAWRRRGLGAALTEARMDWVAARAPRVRYFASAENRTTIALHARFGFVEETRDFQAQGVSFTGGVGILFRAELDSRGDPDVQR